MRCAHYIFFFIVPDGLRQTRPLTESLTHETSLKTNIRIADFSLNLCARNKSSNGVYNYYINGA